MFVYATDFANYRDSDRSFAYPPEKWPFAITQSTEELQEAIAQFDPEAYGKKVQEHHQSAGAYEKGTASQQVVQIIKEKIGGKKQPS